MENDKITNELISETFYELLFSTLIANMPRDTYNMMTQSKLQMVRDNGSHWIITITGPKSTHAKGGAGDYAYNVNYNARRGPKERANYKYVERYIKQTATVMGLRVNV